MRVRLNIFVNNNSDDALCKALDKAKLVQKEVQVQTKNGMVTRKQWVKAGEEPKTDKPAKKAEEVKEEKTKSDEKADKVEKFILDMAKDADKMSRGDLQASVEAFAMTNGLDDNELLDKIDKQATYDKNLMANADKYDKIDTNDKDRMSKMSNPASVNKAKNRLAELRDNEQSSAKDQKSDDSVNWTKPTDKASLIRLLQSGMSKEDIMSSAKADGVVWKHSDNTGINWMRCSMALTGTSTRGAAKRQ